MVVTSSRLHAIRYKQAIDRYITEKDYTGLRAQVAFSGKVLDHGLAYTEPSMNGFPESETATRFGTEEYQVLIVAESSRLARPAAAAHDVRGRVLTGLAAVQTLSRLNRIHPLKTDTFVLDFRNDAEEVAKAFEPWYGKTVAIPSDANLLWDARRRLDDFDVLRPDEIGEAVGILVTISDPKGHGEVYAALDPAVERFKALAEEDELSFRDALNRFVRTYSFLSQIVSFSDTTMERDYVYCRALAACLRDAITVERLDLGSEVQLSHLRNEITFEGSLSLASDTGEVKTLFGDAMGKRHEPDFEQLSKIIEVLNKHFGMNLGEADQHFFDAFEESWVADPDLAAQARENSIDNFRLMFDRKFMNTIVTRMDDNEAIFKQVLDDDDFRQVLADFYLRKVYARLRASS